MAEIAAGRVTTPLNVVFTKALSGADSKVTVPPNVAPAKAVPIVAGRLLLTLLPIFASLKAFGLAENLMLVHVELPSTNVPAKAPSSMVIESVEIVLVATIFTPAAPGLNVIPLNAPFLIVTFAAKAGKTISVNCVVPVATVAPAKAFSPISKAAVFAGSFIAASDPASIPVNPSKAWASIFVNVTASDRSTILIADLLAASYVSTLPAISVGLPLVATVAGRTIPTVPLILLTATNRMFAVEVKL
ncbi:hypothetical protein Barb6_03924 [Bacteroidales bacterium Barb6]|nr:hypothetical protein Barb6_03924 [Bacteroidales bacterium Barb6]